MALLMGVVMVVVMVMVMVMVVDESGFGGTCYYFKRLGST